MLGLRDFLLVWSGQLISGVGSRVTSFALGLWVLQTTGSTTRFAFVFVAMAVPALLIAPLAGALVDRWDRRRTMIACEAISMTVMLAMALLLWADALSMWHVYAGVGITAVANAFLQPAYAASVPLLASPERLTRVNGLVQTGTAVAQVGGPLLAGVLVSAISMQGVLLVDAATFGLGVLALAAARIPRPRRSAPSAETSLWQEAEEGFRYVRERPGLLGLLLVFGVTNFLFGIASIAITPLVLSMATPAQLGLQMAIGGCGLLLGGVLMSLWHGPARRIDGVLLGSLGAGVMLAAHGLQPSFYLLAAAGFAFFLMIPLIHACNASLWQTKVPGDLQGRCFAIQRVLAESAMPIGFCLAGPLAERVFEPWLMPGGALAASVGALIGTGAGRGIALMFIVLGALMVLVSTGAYAVRAIRCVETDLADATVVADDNLPCAA